MAYLLQDKICWALPPELRKVLQLTAEDSSSFLAYFSQANHPCLRLQSLMQREWPSECARPVLSPVERAQPAMPAANCTCQVHLEPAG
eukprot:1159633-Pelagomonas_calceolata.AAC.7